jgi:phosphopantothenoylcysteine decarboxylase/phosphopantothenate--cysteine ligase
MRTAFGQYGGALRQKRIVVTAGGTHEAIDPVRYITNKSSGKQGYAVAQAALDAGANVTLITTPTGLPLPIGAEVIPVESAEEMLQAVLTQTETADALVMAAAVADYRPLTVADHKIKKTDAELKIELARTTDILYTVGQRRRETNFPRVLIGFAAETENLLDNAQSKLERKNADIILANDVSRPGAGFSGDTNIVTLLYRDGHREVLEMQSKAAVAERLMTRIREFLAP